MGKETVIFYSSNLESHSYLVRKLEEVGLEVIPSLLSINSSHERSMNPSVRRLKGDNTYEGLMNVGRFIAYEEEKRLAS